MKALIISGSPRKGNSEFVLKAIYDKLDCDKKIILLRNLNIKHCMGCLNCHENHTCGIEDDMKNVLKEMIESDLIIIGGPNYFDNVSGLLKDFIDRCHPLYKPESVKDKKLINIMVGGGKVEGSKKFLDSSMFGFVKYLKLDLFGSFCFQGLHSQDLENDENTIEKIDKIINSLEL